SLIEVGQAQPVGTTCLECGSSGLIQILTSRLAIHIRQAGQCAGAGLQVPASLKSVGPLRKFENECPLRIEYLDITFKHEVADPVLLSGVTRRARVVPHEISDQAGPGVAAQYMPISEPILARPGSVVSECSGLPITVSLPVVRWLPSMRRQLRILKIVVV